jgi:hypothetical protein
MLEDDPVCWSLLAPQTDRQTEVLLQNTAKLSTGPPRQKWHGSPLGFLISQLFVSIVKLSVIGLFVCLFVCLFVWGFVCRGLVGWLVGWLGNRSSYVIESTPLTRNGDW